MGISKVRPFSEADHPALWGTYRTYLEREWRYVPHALLYEKLRLAGNQADDEIIRAMSKPHFPDEALPISDLKDLRYIVMESDAHRSAIFKGLTNRFGLNSVLQALINGDIQLLTTAQVRNDF